MRQVLCSSPTPTTLLDLSPAPAEHPRWSVLSSVTVPPPPPMATTPNQERLLDTGVFAETTSGTCLYFTDHLLAACRNCPPGSQNEECKEQESSVLRISLRKPSESLGSGPDGPGMLRPACVAAVAVMAGRDSGDSLAGEWVRLTLTEKIACAAAAACSPPRPSPAPRTAAESRRLAEAHARAAAAREEWGRDGRGGTMAGMPVFPGRRGGEERRQVTWCRHQAQPDWWILPRSQPRGSGFQARSSPLPSLERPGVRWPLAEEGGAGILLSPLDVRQPAPWLRAAVFTAAWEME
ncbi:hypothetical protein R6Z07F_003338 [Ovis aries]